MAQRCNKVKCYGFRLQWILINHAINIESKNVPVLLRVSFPSSTIKKFEKVWGIPWNSQQCEIDVAYLWLDRYFLGVVLMVWDSPSVRFSVVRNASVFKPVLLGQQFREMCVWRRGEGEEGGGRTKRVSEWASTVLGICVIRASFSTRL